MSWHAINFNSPPLHLPASHRASALYGQSTERRLSQLTDSQSILPVMHRRRPRRLTGGAERSAVAPGWPSWWARMVLGMELLMSAPHQASVADLWGAGGVRERVSACFLAGAGDRWHSPPLSHPLFQLPLTPPQLAHGAECCCAD